MLVVEDDGDLAAAIAAGLRRARLAVDVASDGDQGLEYARANDYDVIILDRDLPALHGDEVCRAIVASGRRARILMLTASATIGDRVDGLRIGADDYLTKPFAFAELLARVGALARRAHPSAPPLLVVGDIEIDSGKHRVTRGGALLELSPKEFAVLEILAAADGRVVSAEELLERVWDETSDPFTSSVKVTVSRLRTKLGAPAVIETVPRAGYRM